MEKKRILVVEDSPESLMILRIRLEANGFEVIAAADGVEGLTKARELHPDLIVLDVMLPKMDGFTMCRFLKYDEEYKDIPVIMLTARGQDQDVALGRSVGANMYFIKPYDSAKLLKAIGKLTSTVHQSPE
ncbi:DNA-binding response regulator MtrA [bacterium BMS3Abin05]|nr:DNA-binding response regulator MtrA [bacterium BMS3Abin05]GBE26802.1 DNA-binding response regulator MtrA [bacterium BMS3Bbin03]HDK35877.1 response regulator [Bacteroidota bacterium]HDZ12361.1 response regulator [Bacteroidota bacterium]